MKNFHCHLTVTNSIFCRFLYIQNYKTIFFCSVQNFRARNDIFYTNESNAKFHSQKYENLSKILKFNFLQNFQILFGFIKGPIALKVFCSFPPVLFALSINTIFKFINYRPALVFSSLQKMP